MSLGNKHKHGFSRSEAGLHTSQSKDVSKDPRKEFSIVNFNEKVKKTETYWMNVLWSDGFKRELFYLNK